MASTHGERPATAPALAPPRWAGRKSAVVAALAIGMGTVAGPVGAVSLADSHGAVEDGAGVVVTAEAPALPRPATSRPG